MNTFTINGNEYVAKKFDFNLVCDLEDMGVALSSVQEKPMTTARAYFALCTGKGKEFAGAELESHIVNGGDFTDLIVAMSEEMEKSDFFRNLSKRTEKETGKNQKEKK